MIPLSLTLSNFTSYGETPQTLDFGQFHLAAISGQNGAGKSSLLDAITWALWGTSRAGDSADSLIRLGTNDMYVEFSFKLDSNIFIVKRRRSKKGGGTSTLEFWNSNTHNLTEGTLKATQQKIIDTLHLTFETFSNSSFLRQGNADEFTTKGPTDRKRILADILGLDHYDKLEERAKDRSKESLTKLQLLEYQLLEIEAELSQKEEREKSLSQVEEAAKQTEKQLLEIEGELKTLQEEHQQITSLVKSFDDKKIQVQSIEKELSDLQLQVSLKERAKKEFENILSQKSDIETNYEKLQSLRNLKQSLESKRSELIRVKDELTEIQRQLVDRENKRTEAISKLEIEVRGKTTIIEELDKQNKHLNDHKDSCPTCGQTIGKDKNAQIIQTNIEKIENNKKDLVELEAKISKYKSVILPEEAISKSKELEVKKIEEETKSYFEINSQELNLSKYEELYSKLQQAQVGVKTHLEAMSDLQKILSLKQDQMKQLQTDLENVTLFEKKLTQSKISLEAKEIVRKEVSNKALALQGEIGEKRQLVDRAKQLEDLFEKRKVEKQKLSKEKEAYEELALAFGKKGIQAMIIENAIPEVEDETNRLLESLTEGRMKIRFDTQRETKTKVLKEDGKKEFATVETLDIIISDEMGERAYEMYSGGETFRVNFSIRLAISKLLAHRAGAKLQFLVIDEGFGTQDSQGRSKLIEVINAIKSDFEKILIITHIDELKEEFPTRVEVSKGSTGSTFEVVGEA